MSYLNIITISLWPVSSIYRYPGLPRESLPQESYEPREAAEMPPPQSRLLQYRQVQQPHVPGELPSSSTVPSVLPSSTSSSSNNHNHTSVPGPFPYPETSRELPFHQQQAFGQAALSLPSEHVPVKYLLPEAHWDHAETHQSPTLSFGLQQGPFTQLQLQQHKQQQQQQLQAPHNALHSLEEVRLLKECIQEKKSFSLVAFSVLYVE